jgi:hypothetical protein
VRRYSGGAGWLAGFPLPLPTRENLEIKKVEISLKNPETYQIMRFSSIKS